MTLSLDAVRKARALLGDRIRTTPVWRCASPFLDTQPYLKLELWQYAGSFKVRAAFLAMLQMTEEERQRGVVAISAGNHAIAVSYAAKQLGLDAKVLMPKTASPTRIAKCQYFGAKVHLADSIQEIFDHIEEIQKAEGRMLIHPFNGETVALGTGTLGLEFYEQVGDLDVLIAGIGGGGLIGGAAYAYKQCQPTLKVIGVEPEGAPAMNLSIKAGKLVPYPNLHTIADSLAVPKMEIYPYTVCRENVDEFLTINDEEMISGMRFLFNEMKLAVEPAAAIGVAAFLGPLRERLKGKRVGIIISGTNIDEHRYCNLIESQA